MNSLYMNSFAFPDREAEYGYRFGLQETCYNTMYPFGIISKCNLQHLEFAPITILYGGNGSGKTTALNVIAEKIHAQRETLYNRSSFFEDYVNLCEVKGSFHCTEKKIITSDDVFDYMLNVRAVNEEVDGAREEIRDEYFDVKNSKFRFESLRDYEQLKKVNLARRKTRSEYVRRNLMKNIRECSNGESAYRYFTDTIQENGLYLLDEPENSLSPERQIELQQFILDSARFFGCQFIIASHSPFLLSMKSAKIYDLDEEVATVKKWTELQNVRAYYNFFKEHDAEF